MAENELGTWFRSIPIVTRWWFSLSIVFPLLGRLGLINGMYYFILHYESIVYRFQVRIKDSKNSSNYVKLSGRRTGVFCTENAHTLSKFTLGI